MSCLPSSPYNRGTATKIDSHGTRRSRERQAQRRFCDEPDCELPVVMFLVSIDDGASIHKTSSRLDGTTLPGFMLFGNSTSHIHRISLGASKLVRRDAARMNCT